MPSPKLHVYVGYVSAFEGKLKLWFDESSYRFTNERTTPIEPYAIDDEAQYVHDEEFA